MHREIQKLIEPAPVGVRIFPACLWPVLIDQAIVVWHQERAWCFIENITLILINMQVTSDKINILHLQAMGNSFDIFACDGGTN